MAKGIKISRTVDRQLAISVHRFSDTGSWQGDHYLDGGGAGAWSQGGGRGYGVHNRLNWRQAVDDTRIGEVRVMSR